VSLSPILDVLIGMAGVYVAFSLLASWCNERAAAALDLRSKGLVNGIYQILNGNKKAFTQFTQDPTFVALLQAGKNTLQPAQPAAVPAVIDPAAVPAVVDSATPPAFVGPAAFVKNGPSYMSKEQFSTIFMNLLAGNGAKMTSAVSAAAAAAVAATTTDPATGVTAAQAAAAAAADVIKSLQAAGNSLGVGPQVQGILAKSGGDYNRFVAGIEALYDDHMDRVSGWYKRRTHTILIMIGAVLAIFFNIDSIRLYEGLSCNSALRGSVSAAATAAAHDTSATPSGVVPGMLQAIPLGWVRQPNGLFDDPIACYVKDATTKDPAAKVPSADPNARKWMWGWYLLSKALGLAITVIALSLGAPFWFDALSCLTNVRAAGKKPDSDAKATT